MMLVMQVMPLIAAAVAHGAVRSTGCEDAQELTAEGVGLAAKALESAERRGKAVPPQSVAYYALENLKQGRRSGYAGKADVMSAAATVCGRVSVRSLDEPMGVDGDDPTTQMTLHDTLADTVEDVDVAAARTLDWDLVLGRLDSRNKVMLTALAAGYGTGEIAARIKVSPPRVCQLKEDLAGYVVDSWGTNGIAEASTPTQWRAGLRAMAERRTARYERRAV
jgi:hypothetical protein